MQRNEENLPEELLEVARELFYKYGPGGVTMDDIASEMGMSKKTLYKYYDGKEDLLFQIFKQGINKRMENYAVLINEAPNIMDGLVSVMVEILSDLEKTFTFQLENLRKKYRKIADEIRKDQMERVTQGFITLLDNGKEQDIIQKNINSDIVSKLFIHQLTQVNNYDLFPSSQYSRAELFEHIMLKFLRGIATPKGQVLLDQAITRHKGEYFRN